MACQGIFQSEGLSLQMELKEEPNVMGVEANHNVIPLLLNVHVHATCMNCMDSMFCSKVIVGCASHAKIYQAMAEITKEAKVTTAQYQAPQKKNKGVRNAHGIHVGKDM